MSEERSLQSQASHRGAVVLSAPAPEAPAGPLTGPHLSHLPNANTFSRPRLQGLRRGGGGCPRWRRPGTGGTLKHPSPLQESGRVLLCPGVWGGAPATPLGLPGALQGPFRTHILSGRTACLPSQQCKPVCCTCESRSLKDSSLRKQSSPSLPSRGLPAQPT